jgi:quercetin dioxygenase-like cupin family protein
MGTESDERPWTPAPLDASTFSEDDGWRNINRSPYDRISGVLYKRASVIKSVRHDPLDPAPELSDLWCGHGETVVTWLLSEAPGTEEGLLQNHDFRALQMLKLAPGAATGQRRHPSQETILYVLAGGGVLRHRTSVGAPSVQRPLREGDVVLISGDEFYSIANEAGDTNPEGDLRLLVLHLGAAMMLDAEQLNG